jgi:hypothetical protein
MCPTSACSRRSETARLMRGLMRKRLATSLACLLLFAACSIQTKVDSLTAERLCREALGEDEVAWERLSEQPPLSRELLQAAAKGPEGRIAADVWFRDAQNDVAICELRNRQFNFARVFVVRSSEVGWTLKRVYGTPPMPAIPPVTLYEPTPPEPISVEPRGN